MTAPASVLAEPWMRGVAANPAAPSEVLLRLLAPPARTAWKIVCEDRALPTDVIDAVVAHPERTVRRGLARNWHVTAEQRGRLVSDPNAIVRAGLAGGPAWHRYPGTREALPDQVLEILLTAQDDSSRDELVTADEIRQELVGSGQISQAFRHRMPGHPNPALRVRAADLWLWLTPGQRDALLADADPEVREAARVADRILDPAAMEADLPEPDCHRRSLLLMHYAVSRTVVERCLAEGRDLWALANNPHTPADVVARLAHDTDPRVRERVASRADLEPEQLSELSRDPDPVVRTRALLLLLPRTWPQGVAIDRVVGHPAESIGPLHEMLTEPQTPWYEQCAVSEHPLLRRVAATCPHLPEELVLRLAGDPDADVRHLLAYHHPLAPPALLLDTFIATPRQRTHLLTLSQMPRTGLQHLLGHHDPDVRALAAADATLPQPPLQLLADPDAHVRYAAAANPLLPIDLITALLQDPETAEAAASNPRLSVERLHELLDAAGLARMGGN